MAVTIEDAINKIFDVFDRVKDAIYEEGPGGKKVTMGETIGLVIEGIGLIPAITSFAVLVEDWKERDPEKKLLWIEAFSARFDLADDELEEQIEKLVESILLLEGSFTKLSKSAIM